MIELRRIERQSDSDIDVRGYLVISEDNGRVIASFFNWEEACDYCRLYNEQDENS